MPEVPIVSPLGKPDLSDQPWLDPGKPGLARRVDHGRLIPPQRLEGFPQPGELRLGESRPDVGRRRGGFWAR